MKKGLKRRLSDERKRTRKREANLTQNKQKDGNNGIQ